MLSVEGNLCLAPEGSLPGVGREGGKGPPTVLPAHHLLTWTEGNVKPTMKLVSQCTAPSTMKAAGREDCRKISVLTTEGTGPRGQRAQD